MKKEKKKQEQEADDVLKDMVQNLNELPTEVLQQLLDNLEAIEKYNKEHPEEIYDEKDDKNEDD